MVSGYRLALVTILFSLPLAGHAQNDPLFLSDDPLELTFEFPVATLVKQAKKKPEVEGVMRFRDPSGAKVEIDMTMTTRGRSRLDYCRFPPLKVNIKKGQAGGTIFEGQNKLKIVTHCRTGSLHERYIRQEFSIYKAYNEITDYSFRARWITATYIDADGKRDDETRVGFLIESNREIAKRLGRDRIETPRIDPAALNPAESNRYELFQYFIANTDWSMLQGPGEEGCCHNGKVLVEPDTTTNWLVIPYDFDQAGLINTKYALPADRLRIRSVRQRLYRGRCSFIEELDANIALFNEKRAAMEQHLLTNAVEGRTLKNAAKFIDEFYETVNSPEEKRERIVERCLGPRPAG